jgi:hypothetical protein
MLSVTSFLYLADKEFVFFVLPSEGILNRQPQMNLKKTGPAAFIFEKLQDRLKSLLFRSSQLHVMVRVPFPVQ